MIRHCSISSGPALYNNDQEKKNLMQCTTTKLNILMYLQMKRDACLDVINLPQYILQYTVANLTSLCNVAFHWLTSEYMQLVNGFMQLTVAGSRRNIVHFHCLFFLKKNVNSALDWG